MRIGFVGAYNLICGVSEHLRYLIYHGLQETTNIIVFARHDSTNVARPDEGFVKRCWHGNKFDELLNALYNHPVDVINIQHEYSLMNTEPLISAIGRIRSMGIRVVTTMHSTRYLENMNTNRIAIVSNWTVTHTHAVGNRVTSIPIPFFDLAIDHEENRKRLDQSFDTEGKFLVGHFGFPYPHKGHREIIDAAKQTGATPVFIFGRRETTDSYVPGIISYCQGQGMSPVVIHDFLEIERVIEILSACDVAVFAHSADTPGQSGAIRIAMGAKIPVVTTQADVIRDAWDVLDVCKPDQLAVTILKARGSQPKHLDYIKSHTWKTAADQYIDIFNGIL